MKFLPALPSRVVLVLSVVAASILVPGLARSTQSIDEVLLPRDARVANSGGWGIDVAQPEPLPPLEPGAGWRPLKLYGGTVTTIAVSPIDPDLVLAGNHAWIYAHGVFVSRDGGRTWTRVSLPLGPYDTDVASDIEFSPDGTPYVLTYRAIMRGNKDATAWQPINDVVPGARFTYPHRIAFDPAHEGEIWVSSLNQIEGLPGNIEKLMRSTDGGVTWTDVAIPLATDGGITAIAFNRNNTDRMVVTFSGLDHSQAWRSLDGGDHWTIGGGTPTNRPLHDAIHDGTRFYVCGGDISDLPGSYNTGVYASDNDGLMWFAQHTSVWPSRQVHDLEYDEASGSILAATGKGIYRLQNGTWNFGVGGTLNQQAFAVAVVPGAHGGILAGVDNFALLRSDDDGASFKTASDGILMLNVNDVASNPENPLELASSFQSLDNGGVFTSSDGGNSWSLAPLPNMRFSALYFGPGGVLYAASPWRLATSPEGIYRRNADGTWTHLGPKHGGTNLLYTIQSIHVSREHPEVIFASGGEWRGGVPYAVIWRSTNGGVNWTQVFSHTQASGSMLVNEVHIVEDGTGQNVLAAETFGGGVLRSQDGGATWAVVPGVENDASCHSLRGTPADPLTFYASNEASAVANSGRSFRTRDGGASWEPLNGPLAISRLEVDRVDANKVFGLQSALPIVARSNNGGDSFDPFDAGLENTAVHDIAWQSSSPCPALLLATLNGVFTRTIDSAPPQISVTLEPNVLWPPDHRLRTIQASVHIADGCDASPSFALRSITTDDGVPAGDIVATLGEGTTSFKLRAERTGKGDRRYVVTFRATDASGNATETSAVVVVPHDRSGAALSSGEPGSELPDRTELSSIAPNPFNPSTVVSVMVARGERATLDVYDVHGALVRRLAKDQLPAGVHRVAWDGRDDSGRAVASGLYFFRLVAAGHVQTRKALLIK